MGDATSVKAAGGVVSVSGSNSLQGLSFFDADISSYAIEDTASALIASSTSKALENLDVAGVTSIKLVDASNPSANATDGASLNAIKAGLTDDGTTMTFNVKDTAANLAAKAANLDEANVVTIGDSASTEVNVANAVLLNGIPNYDNKGAYTIKDTADAVSKSSVEILVTQSLSPCPMLRMQPRARSSMGSIRARAPRISHLTLKILPPILLPRQRTWMWLKRLVLVVLATTRLVLPMPVF